MFGREERKQSRVTVSELSESSEFSHLVDYSDQ